jgi:DNA mismatch repair ATPase MutS
MSLYLRLWFLRPLKDIDVLTKRQSAIEYLHNPSHSDVTSSLSEYLKNIKNVPVSDISLYVCVWIESV